MSKLIPERPDYKPEKRTVGVMVLAAFLLLFAGRLLLKYGSFSQNLEFLLFLEISVFLLPALSYVVFRGRGYSRVLRFKMPRGAHIPFMLVAFVALLSGGAFLSLVCGNADAVGSSVTAFDLTAYPSVLEKVWAVLLMAVLPAVLEEFFFRGIVAAEYERRGAFRAILMSALLFALVHFDLQNLPLYLFAGLLLMLVLYATDSLVATIMLHVLYNVVLLFGGRYLRALFYFTGNVKLFLFLLVLVLLVALLLLCRFGAKIYRRRDEYGIGNPRRDVPYAVQFYTVLDGICDPTIIACVLLSVVGFILF